jgi:hypothetical protein
VAVDLDEEPRMDQSYVEPWVEPRLAVRTPRKGGQGEMENAPGGYGVVSVMAGELFF